MPTARGLHGGRANACNLRTQAEHARYEHDAVAYVPRSRGRAASLHPHRHGGAGMPACRSALTRVPFIVSSRADRNVCATLCWTASHTRRPRQDGAGIPACRSPSSATLSFSSPSQTGMSAPRPGMSAPRPGMSTPSSIATLEAEIDRLVYDLYGLTALEVEIVEG
jgi:hypothetical protein